MIIKCTKERNLVLSRNAWNRLDSVDDVGELKKILVMLLISGEEALREICKALLENNKLYEVYI